LLFKKVKFNIIQQARGAFTQFTFIYRTQLSTSLQNAEGKVVPLYPMKAYRGRTAILNINLGTGWLTAVNFTPHPGEITPVSTEISLARLQS